MNSFVTTTVMNCYEIVLGMILDRFVLNAPFLIRLHFLFQKRFSRMFSSMICCQVMSMRLEFYDLFL